MVEIWTAGWLKATPHKVISPEKRQGKGVRKSLVLFQAHDDLVRVHPLKVDQLHSQGPDSATGTDVQGLRKYNLRSRANRAGRRLVTKKTDAGLGRGQRHFLDWLMYSPEGNQRKYRPTRQGAWVREKEKKAKAASLRL